jgi:hypothetical protein
MARRIWFALATTAGAVGLLAFAYACESTLTLPSAVSTICGYLEFPGGYVLATYPTGASSGCPVVDGGLDGARDGGSFLPDAEAGAGDAKMPDAQTPDAESDVVRADAETDATMPDATPSPTVPASATDVYFVALVTSPAGAWQLTATASGALATIGEAYNFNYLGESSDSAPNGVQPIEVLVPLTIANDTGIGSVQVTVGDSTRDFLFHVAPPSSPPPIQCIQSAGGDAGPRTLAWAVDPASPVVVEGEGGPIVVKEAGAVGTLVVDVEDQLINCADGGGMKPLSSMSVGVAGTGGLAPTVTPVMSNPTGYVTYELRGPAVVDAATAVLSVSSGASTVVTVTAKTGRD